MALFITFEGIEGSGKTTQIKILSKYLKSLGIKHILTREPGGTDFGNKLRELVLIPRFKSLEPLTELCIMLAARCDHVSKIIKKNLERGFLVLCDRFTDATIAYQGGGRKIDKRLIKKLNDLVTFGIKPNLTFLLDLPAEKGLKRARRRLSEVKSSQRESRFENETIKFHRRVRKAYLTLFKNNRRRIQKINAEKTASEIAEEIKGIILNELKLSKRTAKSGKRALKIRRK